jgi:hypothetical protein
MRQQGASCVYITPQRPKGKGEGTAYNLQMRLQTFGGSVKCFVVIFCAMRLRVCVCYVFKFGAGGLLMLQTQTRGLFFWLYYADVCLIMLSK